MCTVIYYPGHEGILLSSNRDERLTRATAIPPAIMPVGNQYCLMPLDAEAGGTWAGVKNNGEAFVLFNGGFKAHVPQPPYTLSRGLVMKAILQADTIGQGWTGYDCRGIEPFSIIYYAKGELNRLVWDGAEKHWLSLDTGSALMWSSATLYNEPASNDRVNHFDQYIQNLPGKIRPYELYSYLQNGMAEDPWNRFVMNRSGIMGTVSVSIIELQQQMAYYHYWDLKADTYSAKTLQIQSNQTKFLHASQEQNIAVVV